MPEVKWSWQHAIIQSTLPSTTKLILHTLNCHMSPAGDRCFPSISTIALESSLTRQSVVNHLEIAEKEGWIVREKNYNGKTWSRNSYLPCFPDEINNNNPNSSDDINNDDEINISGDKTEGVVNDVYRGSQPSILGVVNDVDSNRSVNRSVNKPKEDDVKVSLPKEINPNSWGEWVEYRTEIRKPLKAPSVRKSLKLLAQFSFADQQTMIDTSIQNGWQGLFAPRKQGGKNSYIHKPHFDGSDARPGESMEAYNLRKMREKEVLDRDSRYDAGIFV